MQKEDLIVVVGCVGASVAMLVMSVFGWLPGGGL
jgi:hypothetical protein